MCKKILWNWKIIKKSTQIENCPIHLNLHRVPIFLHFFEFQNDLKWSGVVEIMQVIECNCTCDCTFWYHHFLTIFHKIIDIHIANWIAINCYRNSMQWYNLDFTFSIFSGEEGKEFFFIQKFETNFPITKDFFDRNLKKLSPNNLYTILPLDKTTV